MTATTDPAKWLEAQELVDCPLGIKMTLAACKKRLESKAHYLRNIVPGVASSGLEVHQSFAGCMEKECPHYKPTENRAASCKRQGGNQRGLAERLDANG